MALTRAGAPLVVAASHNDPEEKRFVQHLHSVGYATQTKCDPNGWRVATSPIGPPLFFRNTGRLIRLYARYPAGLYSPDTYADLLATVNGLNAAEWFIRTTLVHSQSEDADELSLSLQADVPAGRPELELGTCLFMWIREATRIERVACSYDCGRKHTSANEEPRDASA